jgi:hypothetical protein
VQAQDGERTFKAMVNISFDYLQMLKDFFLDWQKDILFLVISIEVIIAYLAYRKRVKASLLTKELKINEEENGVQYSEHNINTPNRPVKQLSDNGTYNKDNEESDISYK